MKPVDNAYLRECIEKAVIDVSAEGDWATKDMVDAVLCEVGHSQVVREMAWKIKSLGKQVGKQGQRIYDLRCQLTEARSFVTMDVGSIRRYRDGMREAMSRCVTQAATIRDLQKQLNKAQDEVAVLTAALKKEQQPAFPAFPPFAPVRPMWPAPPGPTWSATATNGAAISDPVKPNDSDCICMDQLA